MLHIMKHSYSSDTQCHLTYGKSAGKSWVSRRISSTYGYICCGGGAHNRRIADVTVIKQYTDIHSIHTVAHIIT